MSGQSAPVTEWLRPLGVGQLLDVAIRAYRIHFLTMVKSVAVVIVPMVALAAMIQLSLLPESPEVTPDPSVAQRCARMTPAADHAETTSLSGSTAPCSTSGATSAGAA